MKALFDTSVLVAALIERHPFHPRAYPWLRKAWDGDLDFHVACHSLAETFSTLTTFPIRPRISAHTASSILDQSVLNKATLVALTADDYRDVIARQTRLGLAGGSIYDALLAWAAAKAGVDLLVTFNEGDFLRVWPEGREKIRVP